ncbi:hypothetical protein [Sphingobacterium sp. LRF_L2]|uniref:hypothetical protein n=1 Tax=Sphingobacterium sp. LRF_L2 TaxID=3369421 RepID=UPI003F6029A4
MRYPAIFSLMLFVACTSAVSTSKQNDITTPADSIDVSPIKNVEEKQPQQIEVPPEIQYVENNTLITGNYRIWETADDPETLLNKGKWLDIHQDGPIFAITPLNYQKSNGYDDCAGIATKRIEASSGSLLLTNLAVITSKEIQPISLMNNKIWPNEKIDFDFLGNTYRLAGVGSIGSSEVFTDDDGHEEIFHEVSDYQLQLIDPKGQTTVLLSEESFQDTFMRIDFVGDLDGDNKPDFIISVPRNYEEERVLLILSTKMSNGKIVVYEASRQFDC